MDTLKETAGPAAVRAEQDRLVRVEVNTAWIRWLLIAAIVVGIGAAYRLDGRITRIEQDISALREDVREDVAAVREDVVALRGYLEARE